MTTDQAVDIVREALTVMLMLSLPVFAAGWVIGLVGSILQAVTQVQEQTLSFVPKIIGMGLVAIVIVPWVTTAIIDFAHRMFSGG